MSSVDVLGLTGRGSGVAVVHAALARAITGYQHRTLSPYFDYCPPALKLVRLPRARIVHTVPRYGTWFVEPPVPSVLTFHNYELDPAMEQYCSALQWAFYQNYLRPMARKSAERATVVTAVSKATAELVRDDLGFEGPIITIPNGTDTATFKPRSSAPRRKHVGILFSGNMSRRKGEHWLPSIASRLHPDATLTCAAGLRGQRSPFRAGNVHWLRNAGHAEMPDVYREHDILILPTVREGMPLVVLEAMASGLAVVASDCSSLPELVAHGHGGFLLPPGDVDAFADALNRLARDRDLRLRMGEYNRQRVLDEFPIERMVDAYEATFERARTDS